MDNGGSNKLVTKYEVLLMDGHKQPLLSPPYPPTSPSPSPPPSTLLSLPHLRLENTSEKKIFNIIGANREVREWEKPVSNDHKPPPPLPPLSVFDEKNRGTFEKAKYKYKQSVIG